MFWAGSSSLDQNPLVDWGFVTEAQAGANGRKLHYPRGYCLGGSSARNFMIYQRPTIDTMSRWVQATGDDSYSWENFLPWLKKSVQFTAPQSPRAANASAEFNSAAFDSNAGPLQVSYANYAGPFSSYMEGSMNEIGIQHTQDFNSGKLMGSQYCSSTIDPKKQARSSSQTSFLNKANSRPNLKVFSTTLAKRIVFDANKKATGVEVSKAGIPFTLSATKEVILSAGAFQSPQLLMVSGVGPVAELKKFNIPLVKDLPGVGQNMEDHIFFGPSHRVQVETFTKLANSPLYVASQFAYDYSIMKRGPLTNPVADFLSWEKVPASLRDNFSPKTQSDLSQFPSDWPEVEYLSAPGYIGDFSNLWLGQPRDGFQYASILAALVAPTSRGTVTLASSDTKDKPLIDPRWLTTETDQQVAIAAYKRVRQAFSSKAMKPVLVGDEVFPGAAVKTDAQILDTIRNTLHTVYHASCTCRMGVESDRMAVVDSKARVYGVRGLRVVDSSSFALLPPGHPQSTVYALAEKIAADILNGT